MQYITYAGPHHWGTEKELKKQACIKMIALLQNAVIYVLKRHQVNIQYIVSLSILHIGFYTCLRVTL